MSKPIIASMVLVHCPVTDKTTWSFLRLGLSDGTIGWGEASWVRNPGLLAGYHAAVREQVMGCEWTQLAHLISAENASSYPAPHAAIWSALEQAMWDIRGQRAGCYAAALTASPRRDRIPLYANINRSIRDRSDAGFRAAGKKAVAAGFNRIKIAPFDGLTPENARLPQGQLYREAGLARIAATRAGIGPAAELYVDCHWRFCPQTASAMLKELAPLGVSWFECPLPETLDNIPLLKRLRGEANNHGMRLAGLEELTSPAQFMPWLAAGVYDVVMPDVKYARGIAGVVEVAAMSAKYGNACAPHNPSGPLCHAASLVACAMDDTIEQLEHQFDETAAFWRLMAADFPRPVDGASALPQAAGLGTALEYANWRRWEGGWR